MTFIKSTAVAIFCVSNVVAAAGFAAAEITTANGVLVSWLSWPFVVVCSAQAIYWFYYEPKE